MRRRISFFLQVAMSWGVLFQTFITQTRTSAFQQRLIRSRSLQRTRWISPIRQHCYHTISSNSYFHHIFRHNLCPWRRQQATSSRLFVRRKTTDGTELRQQSPWEEGLNEAQLEAVTKPLLSVTRVVAGPGSGKTRVLTSRIAHILKEDPQTRILAVTFTRKAAGEMQQRLENLLKNADPATQASPTQPASGDPFISEEEFSEGSSSPTYLRELSRVTLGTFHKICADILRYNGNLLASLPSVHEVMVGHANATSLDGSFAIMDQSDQLRIMKECITSNSIDLQKAGVKPLMVLDVLLQMKSKAMEGQNPFGVDEPKKPLPKHVEIARKIYSSYRVSMLSNNLLDFDDLIYLARELLLESQQVRQQLHRRWTHILVDEYQDTSRAQIDLVRLWTSSSLLVVGDGDQSIYSWRGADPNSLSTFEDEFRNFLGDIETVHLTENYRSTANIVKAAQKVIKSGERSMAEKLRQKMNPNRGSGSTPRIVACADGKAEATFVVKTIQEALASGDYTPETSAAVLYRTNAQSRMLEEACVNNNLPYVILGKATSFYKRREVKDCLCFLRWLYNGRDKGSMIRAFQTPSRGIGDKAMEQFENYCALLDEHFLSIGRPRPTYLDVLLSFQSQEDEGTPLRNENIATRPLKLFTEFSQQMQKLLELARVEPVEKVLAAVIAEFDLMAHFDKVSDSKTEFQERQSNVMELQQATRKYSQEGAAIQEKQAGGSEEDFDAHKSPLGAFLDDVALVTETADEANEDPSSKRFVVSLMTIHAAKGMEFDTVFVVGNEDNCLPTAQAIQAGQGSVELAEECRLCYVAMTRAKSELFLTWRREAAVFAPDAPSGFRYVKRNRSRFLDALTKKATKAEKASSPTSTKSTKVQSPLKSSVAGKKSDGTPAKRARYYSNGRWYTRRNKPQTRPPERPAAERSASNRASILSQDYQPTPQSSSNQSFRRQQPSTRLSTIEPPTRRGIPDSHTASPRPNKTKNIAPKKKKLSAMEAMDSTWFYPVGSSVVHKEHGRGLVLNPPPPNGKLLVRVKFENGQRLDVPAEGDALRREF